MIIEFEKNYFEELYTEGKTKSKKHRFQKTVIKQYKKTIDKLRVARRVEDLYPIASLNYEKLSGKKEGMASVRVNKQYRIEFKSKIEGEEPHVISICSIIELSNHYK